MLSSQKILVDSDFGSRWPDGLEGFERRPGKRQSRKKVPGPCPGFNQEERTEDVEEEGQLGLSSYSSHILTSLNKHVGCLALL